MFILEKKKEQKKVRKSTVLCSYMVSYSIVLLLFEGCSLDLFIMEGSCEFSMRAFHSLSHFCYALRGDESCCESFMRSFASWIKVHIHCGYES